MVQTYDNLGEPLRSLRLGGFVSSIVHRPSSDPHRPSARAALATIHSVIRGIEMRSFTVWITSS